MYIYDYQHGIKGNKLLKGNFCYFLSVNNLEHLMYSASTFFAQMPNQIAAEHDKKLRTKFKKKNHESG